MSTPAAALLEGLRGGWLGILGLNHMLPTLQMTSGSLAGPALFTQY